MSAPVDDVRANVRSIAERVRAGAAFTDVAQGRLAGATALVVSCGPSIERWRRVHDRLTAEGSSPVVLCVKQSVDIVGGLCDVHVFNAFNLQRYRYGAPRPLVVSGLADARYPSLEPADVRYRVVAPPDLSRGFEPSLSGQLDFAEHELCRTGLDARPWGPGIMYEIVFPLLVHLGVARIVTVGWDIAAPSGENVHFYDRAAALAPSVRPSGVRGRLERSILGRQLVARLRRARGERYNPATMLEGEADVVAAAVPRLLSWLRGRGVVLEADTDSAWLSEATAG